MPREEVVHQGAFQLFLSAKDCPQSLNLPVDARSQSRQCGLFLGRRDRHDDLLHVAAVDLQRAVGGLGPAEDLVVNNRMVPGEDREVGADSALTFGTKDHRLVISG